MARTCQIVIRRTFVDSLRTMYTGYFGGHDTCTVPKIERANKKEMAALLQAINNTPVVVDTFCPTYLIKELEDLFNPISALSRDYLSPAARMRKEMAFDWGELWLSHDADDLYELNTQKTYITTIADIWYARNRCSLAAKDYIDILIGQISKEWSSVGDLIKEVDYNDLN